MSTVEAAEQEIVVHDAEGAYDGGAHAEDAVPAIVRVSGKTLAESVFACEMPITTRYEFDPAVVQAITKRKIQAIAAINPVAKRGTAKVTNTSSYDYAKPEDVFKAANEALVEAGLDVTPIPRGTQQILAGKTYNGTDMVLTRIYVDMLVASEEGYVLIPWMADAKMMDPSKSIQAGLTYAHRTFLIHFLRIPTPTLEDADAESHGAHAESHGAHAESHGAYEGSHAPAPQPRRRPTRRDSASRNGPAAPNGQDAGPDAGGAHARGAHAGGAHWNANFWNEIAALGYWTGDNGEVNKRHFFNSLKNSWPQNPGLSQRTAHDLLAWAKKYVQLKEDAEVAGREDLSDEETEALIEKLSEELYG